MLLHQNPRARPHRRTIASTLGVVILALVAALVAVPPTGVSGADQGRIQATGDAAGTPAASNLPTFSSAADRPSSATLTSRASAAGGRVLVARTRAIRSEPNPRRIVPRPGAAGYEDRPAAYADGCHVIQSSSALRRCVYGDRRGRITVALVGDSKALQWLPALQAIAARRHWRIELYTKSACAFAPSITLSLNGRPYTTCRSWNAKVAKRLAANPPDIVLTSSTRPVVVSSAGRVLGTPALSAGLRRAWAALDRAGSKVLVLRDNPSPSRDIPGCVAAHRRNVLRCSYPRDKGLRLSGGPAQLRALRTTPSATMIDMTPQVCPRSSCQAVVNGVLALRRGSHFTATFARGMSRELERLMLRAAPVARQP